ncbi:hypothetical protein P168DRAFT_283179 [Aspergillus campestris IBT 28561]|uniref:Uncharacterized protein n=1 Tax=Aspergillus campestris (strain IBT 28561) TaxID=1392248 RepID=A0A2I1D0P3_ASPC2|nr:uncharacterized protein P168DRAFT_283179 [Aspergillus campestris IBT 28561]PKY03439.1 hypothetical protein P168DRAFT_283179 [Aspergillus campestris IBT 28561]
MSVSWEVTSFAVQTTTVDQVADRLFANGNMQVPVIVTLNAINPTTGVTHRLTDTELQKIQLIDYHSGAVLMGTWFYSLTPNDFAHTLAGTNDPVEPTSDAPQSIRLYVSSTRIENRVIGARITQPNDTVVTTNSTIFNSFVTLTAIQPVFYDTNNITLGDKQKVATGNWIFTSAINGNATDFDRDWRQENYYVTSNVHPILKADLHDYRINETWTSDPLNNSFSLQFNRHDLNIFYFWNLGPETSRQVGLKHILEDFGSGQRFDPFIISTSTKNAIADVQVNQQRNAFCLTHMTFFHNNYWQMTPWSQDAWVRLYDTFGNYGDFYVKVRENPVGTDEDKSIEYSLCLQNKNTANLTEPVLFDPAAKL